MSIFQKYKDKFDIFIPQTNHFYEFLVMKDIINMVTFDKIVNSK